MNLEYYLSIPKEHSLTLPLIAGKKVSFIPEVKDKIIEYYLKNKENKNANEKWLKIGEVLLRNPEEQWFTLLHIADFRSVYPIGTAIIEISPHEDMELRGDVLFSLEDTFKQNNIVH